MSLGFEEIFLLADPKVRIAHYTSIYDKNIILLLKLRGRSLHKYIYIYIVNYKIIGTSLNSEFFYAFL